jgi:hypothetical protein
MSSVAGDERSGGSILPGLSLSDADRAFLLAMAAWGAPPRQTENGPDRIVSDLRARVRRRLGPAGFARVCNNLLHDSSQAMFRDPLKARERLSRMHVAGARVEPAQVHPSWWVRALREESPAVQRLVASEVPAYLREPLQSGLLLDRDDLRSERPASAEVVSWVLALWTERLVGGEVDRSDDPPAIIVLGRLSPRAGYRLCRLAGVCKLILAGQMEADAGRSSNRARHEWLETRLPVDAELQAMARLDVEAGRSSKLPPRRHLARIGLVTLARLLADAEPFRLRWALQHWPYPMAKIIRSLMPPTGSRSVSLLEWESLVLKTAWDRLNVEGRLALNLPDAHAEEWSHWT